MNWQVGCTYFMVLLFLMTFWFSAMLTVLWIYKNWL